MTKTAITLDNDDWAWLLKALQADAYFGIKNPSRIFDAIISQLNSNNKKTKEANG